MEKHEKVASFPRRGRESLRIYSWCSLSDLKHDQKCFIRMRPSGTFFSQFDQTVTTETMTVRKIATSVLAMYFQVL